MGQSQSAPVENRKPRVDDGQSAWSGNFNTGHQASLQSPNTLAMGAGMGSAIIGTATLTEMEHPTVNAGMGGITGQAGGGRLNPWGMGSLVEAPATLQYMPTATMPKGVPFATEVLEPKMGGEVPATTWSPWNTGQEVRWGAQSNSGNPNASVVDMPRNWGNSVVNNTMKTTPGNYAF